MVNERFFSDFSILSGLSLALMTIGSWSIILLAITLYSFAGLLLSSKNYTSYSSSYSWKSKNCFADAYMNLNFRLNSVINSVYYTLQSGNVGG